MAGGVACKDDSLTNWGCHPSNYTTISTVITDENKIVLPAGVRYNRFGAYSLPGYSSQSSILTLRDPFPKYTTQKYFRVGFSEDLMGFESNKTHGWNSCFDVYAKIRVPQCKFLIFVDQRFNVFLLGTQPTGGGDELPARCCLPP